MATKQPVKIVTVDDYIAAQPGQIKIKLERLRATIKKAAPKAEELISYKMPAFRFHGILVWFASFNNHYSLFVRPKYKEIFKDELKAYKTTKSAIHFQFDKALPVQLVTKIIKYAAKANLEQAQLKEMTKGRKTRK